MFVAHHAVLIVAGPPQSAMQPLDAAMAGFPVCLSQPLVATSQIFGCESWLRLTMSDGCGHLRPSLRTLRRFPFVWAP